MTPPAAKSAQGPSLAERFLANVRSLEGVPYVWGGTSRAGVDCSGLVWLAAKQAGITVPRTAEAQFSALPHISASQAQPGDLVYFVGADGAVPGHVGVVDSPGGNWHMIDAPHTGTVVQDQAFSFPGTGENRVVGFARLPGAGQAPAASAGGGGGGGLFSLLLPPDAIQLFDDATHFVNSAMWILNPENWLRILAGAAAVLFVAAGAGFLLRAA